MTRRMPGKGRFDLISPYSLEALAKAHERGVELGYPERGCEEDNSPMSLYIDKALRHINNHKKGMRDEDHLGQAMFDLEIAIHKLATRPELDDLPRYEQPKASDEIRQQKTIETFGSMLQWTFGKKAE